MKRLNSLLATLLILFSLNSSATPSNQNADRELSEGSWNQVSPRLNYASILNDENSNLKADIIRLETQVQALEQENLLLRDRRARDWFISGTGVILMGFFMGFLAHKIQNQQKSSW